MPIIAREIKETAELYIGIDIDSDMAVRIINDGLNRLGILGLVYAEISILGEAMNWVPLPDDRIEILYVLDSKKRPYYSWEYETGMIRFSEDGKYTVSARKMANPISKIGDEIDLPDIYKSSLTSYLIGFIKLKDDDESPDGMRNMAEFEKYAGKAYQSLMRRRKPSQVKVIR